MQPARKNTTWRTILRWVFRVLIFQFVLINIAAAFHAHRLTHFYTDKAVYEQQGSSGSIFLRTWRLMTGKRLARSPIQYTPPTAYETLAFQLKNGKKISAWYIPTDSAVGTVILVHGLGSNKGHPLNEASEFRVMGYNTLLIDLRAHGESEGKAFSIGYKETEEIKLAYDHLRAKGEKNIVFWGMSVGAVVMTKAIADYELKPEKLILEMPFGSLQDHLRSRARNLGFPDEPFAFFVTFWVGLEQGYWGYGFKTAKYAKKIQCPVLIQWGNQDDYVKEGEVRSVFDAVPGTDKKLVIYEKSGHVPLCWSENEKWVEEVERFINR
ncbi:MAG: alpha/beta hydrolase [Chitinophagales bacterium]|nr:alpha/beta hydrolase [Chitinophagales bacterium]